MPFFNTLSRNCRCPTSYVVTAVAVSLLQLCIAGCGGESSSPAAAGSDGSSVSRTAPSPPGLSAGHSASGAVAGHAPASRGEMPAAIASNGTPAPAGEWIDLIPRTDAARHAIAGTWNTGNGTLSVESQAGARLQLPWQAPEEYDLEVRFVRLSGAHSIAVMFKAGGGQAALELDAWNQHLAGIQQIAGRDLRANSTRVEQVQLENGREYSVLLQVRRRNVEAFLDGRRLAGWKQGDGQLTLLDVWALPDRHALGLGAWNSETEFRQVRVRAVPTGIDVASRPPAEQPPDAAVPARRPVIPDAAPLVSAVVSGPAGRPSSSSRESAAPADTSEPLAVLTADSKGFQEVLTPFLRQHCLRCHGPEEAEGELRVDTQLPNEFVDRAIRSRWNEVLNVLNSHEMPPAGEPQPAETEVAAVVDWITGQISRAELASRDSAVVLRRLNRIEYRNTIRDLTGVDFDPSGFPQDPPAGGFDNNGGALTLSPLLLELYYDAAREILQKALVEGERPPVLKWRFEPESGDSDSNRVVYDGQRVIVNGGKNRAERGFRVMHHANWDRTVQARDFAVPHEGEYIIRVRAAGRVPDRRQVVEVARRFIDQRMAAEIRKNPAGERYVRERFTRELRHYETDRMYDYGDPRLKVSVNITGQPRVVAEIDVAAPVDRPQVYEFRTHFNTYRAGIRLEYAYEIPREIENAWLQTGDEFPRPELWIDWFELEGPVYESWPPPGHRQILDGVPRNVRDERQAARQVIARFLRRAWRRPVTDEEVDAKLALFTAARPNASSFVAALRMPLVAILVSPQFLFLAEPVIPSQTNTISERSEPATAANGEATAETPVAPAALTTHQLAARLSYYLWSSMPDEELTALADSGELARNEILLGQLRRMLDDPRSSEFVKNFAGQWLGLREVGANPPAADLYPRYDRHLELSIVAESQAFFAEILRNDLDVMNFIRSDFVTINERLARFYGIPGVEGDAFRRVRVPAETHRGGVLTQAAVLSVTSNGTRTSPVKRGTWILSNILGADPGLPVANAGEIAPRVPGIDRATVRQRLEIHRQLPQCARCHNRIDPLGFALENFNAAGEWRDREGFGYKGRVGPRDPQIDASSQLPDGTRISGIDGLQQALLAREEQFLGCLAEKMMTYALGRELGVADRRHVTAAVAHLQQHNRTLPSLLQFIVTSEPFRTK